MCGVQLAELPASERLAYKGITKKRIRVSVQRLVLILPVEQQGDVPVEEGEQHNLPGGKAGGIQAPPDEVSQKDQVANVKNISGLYDVIWDSEKMVYRAASVQDVHGTAAGGQVEGGEHVQGGLHGVHDDAVGSHGACEGGASSEMKQRLRCSAVLRSKVECTDFERKIYEEKSKAIDWKKVDEEFGRN